jgi:leucyl/phenylalanyl-tRNA--protein transferase
VETWQEGKLVGGLYGVSLGGCFFGESMFARVDNASKVALVCLVDQLAQWQFELIDCQVETAHMKRFGAREIPRSRFLVELEQAMHASTRRGVWELAAADH